MTPPKDTSRLTGATLAQTEHVAERSLDPALTLSEFNLARHVRLQNPLTSVTPLDCLLTFMNAAASCWISLPQPPQFLTRFLNSVRQAWKSKNSMLLFSVVTASSKIKAALSYKCIHPRPFSRLINMAASHAQKQLRSQTAASDKLWSTL